MATALLPQHHGLRSNTRLRFLIGDSDAAATWEWLTLLGAGVAAAAASTFLDYNLRIPGHSILRIVFPMAFGLALVPRHRAGTLISLTAFVTSLGFRLAGFGGDGLSLGAMTSLSLTGPLLDWTLRRNRGGWRLYFNFAIAGLTSNVTALFVRGLAKLVGWEHAGGRPFSSWLSQAIWSYLLCGLLAGLISGAFWFGRRRRDDSSAQGAAL